MQKELAIIRSAFDTLHPGTYRYNTRQQIDGYFRQAHNRVVEPIGEDQYDILLAQLATKIKCGHTYLNYWNQEKTLTDHLYSKSLLPFLFRLIGGHIIITHNLSENMAVKPGTEILSINGIRSGRIIDSLLTVSQSDGNHGMARKLDNINIEPLDADTSNYNLFDIYFPLIFQENFNAAGYQLKLKSNIGKMSIVHVKSLGRTARLSIYNNRFGILPVHEKNWSLKFLGKETACFTIGDFETWEWKADYRKYLDSIFTLLKLKQVENLIVDIRGNGGGDDEARDEVFSYLTDKPFGCDDPMHRRFRFLAVPDTLLPYLKTWNKSFKAPKNTEDYIQIPGGWYESKADINTACTPMQPKSNCFTGRKFLIIDGRNSSTTFTLAKLFRTAGTGEIIGETTGGNQQGINGGQFFFLYLPYSKIEIDIPLVWGAYPGKRPDTGIEPDTPVGLSALSISRNDDLALALVLKEIAAAK